VREIELSGDGQRQHPPTPFGHPLFATLFDTAPQIFLAVLNANANERVRSPT